ncbi:MAG: hypothetical protein NE328_06295, partial [Lentisphaeraceae bacterium]|nr:hypothetical protein [Lentisphaeraceae bacterium]
LTRLISETLSSQGYKDEKVIKKHQKALKKRETKAKKLNRMLNPFLWIGNRMSRISQQFIRSIQTYFLRNIAYGIIKPKLIKKLMAYI